jgi:hypothetical protein
MRVVTKKQPCASPSGTARSWFLARACACRAVLIRRPRIVAAIGGGEVLCDGEAGVPLKTLLGLDEGEQRRAYCAGQAIGSELEFDGAIELGGKIAFDQS